MKTRFIAVFPFLALFLSLNLFAHDDKEFEAMHEKLHDAKVAMAKKILAKNDVDNDTIGKIVAEFESKKDNFHFMHHLFHMITMHMVKKILKENGVSDNTIKNIKKDFKQLKLKAMECLMDCCKKHHADEAMGKEMMGHPATTMEHPAAPTQEAHEEEASEVPSAQ